ncbi:hypothetical protein ACVXHA_25050 [Escherichia coli]
MLGGEAIEHENSPVSLMISGCCTASASVWWWSMAHVRRSTNLAAHHHEPLYHKNIRVTDANTGTGEAGCGNIATGYYCSPVDESQ